MVRDQGADIYACVIAGIGEMDFIAACGAEDGTRRRPTPPNAILPNAIPPNAISPGGMPLGARFPIAMSSSVPPSMSPGTSRHAAAPAAMAGRPTKLARVTAFVDGALHRCDLTVRAIALAVGVSRSVLYRHFAPFGGIARFVRDRRVAALQRAVACPAERRSFAAIARSCGYASPSHANRCFKARFGVAPGAYRRLARAGQA